jgi:hypothetical protein
MDGMRFLDAGPIISQSRVDRRPGLCLAEFFPRQARGAGFSQDVRRYKGGN